MISEPDIVSLTNLAPEQLVTVRASCFDARGEGFSSWATYKADYQGRAIPSAHPSIAGSYRGLDPFGLWWSMKANPERPFASHLKPVIMRVRAEVEGQLAARTSFRRLLLPSGVSLQPVQGEAFVARFFEPEHTSGRGVVVLGGSGGGLGWAQEYAALLAFHGYAALAVAYFGAPGLPDSLSDIPIEGIFAATTWLLAQPSVSSLRVGVMGSSRGGELALLLGSRFQEIGCVVAYLPSHVAWGGFTARGVKPGHAWSLDGRPVPYAVPRLDAVRRSIDGGMILLDAFVEATEDDGRMSEAAIPTERINGPLLLISAGNDLMWPSGMMSRSILARRMGVAGSELDRHLHYSEAGHGLSWPSGFPALPLSSRHPVNGRVYELGGSRHANAAAASDAWPKVLAFLEESLSEVWVSA